MVPIVVYYKFNKIMLISGFKPVLIDYKIPNLFLIFI